MATDDFSKNDVLGSAAVTPVQKSLQTAALIAAFAALLVLPFLWLGVPSGHDFEFHVSSWYDVAGQWHQGMVYPRWAVWANYGAGEPRFVFYPPLSWIWGAALSLVLPYTLLPAVFVWSLLVLAGTGAYLLARRWMSRGAAYWAAAVYVVNPYTVILVYWRSAFAEMLGMALLPFLLIAFLIFRERGSARDVVVLSITFSAVWLANTPSALLVSYLLAVLALLDLRSIELWAKFASSLVLGLALTAFYLLPAIYEQRWLDLSQVLDPTLSPRNNTLFVGHGTAIFLAYNKLVSSAALAILLVAIIATIANWRVWTRTQRLMTGTIAAMGALLLSPLSALIWEHAPKLRFVQFPWRFSFVLALAAALGISASGKRIRLALLILLFALPLAIVRTPTSETYMIGSDDAQTVRDGVQSGNGYEGQWDYAPAFASIDAIKPEDPALAFTLHQGRGRLVSGSPLNRRYEVHVAREGADVQIKLLDYPAWKVQLDGSDIAHDHDDSGRITAHVPGGEHTLIVRWNEPHVRLWGDAISMCALAVIAALTRKRPRLPAVAS